MKIILIDLSGLFWANWHATKDLELGEAYERTVSKVHALRQGFTHAVVCCDSPPYFRKEILPGYKAQRDAPPPQAVEQLERVKRRLRADALLVWEFRGFEADDVIASSVAALRGAGHEIVVASSDKDLLQLVSDEDRVTVRSPMSGDELNRAKVIEKFGVDPTMLGDLLALWGDASDNVPGVPGIGPKNAAKLLLEFGTLEGVLTHVDDIPGVLGQRLLVSGPAARLARKVIELRKDVPLDVKEIFVEREPEKLATREYEMGADDGPLDAIGPPVETPPKTDALARVDAPAVSFELQLEPSSIGGAYKLAQGMTESRLYSKFQNAEAIWAVIIRGREMGLGALTALDCFHVIEGKPALSAHLILARAKQHPDCEYFQFVAGDDTFAEYVTKRRENPEPTRMRYTIEQAKVAGLCPDKPRERNPRPDEKDRRSNWEKRPDEMLRKTCAVQLARIEYPEAALGLYAIEELE